MRAATQMTTAPRPATLLGAPVRGPVGAAEASARLLGSWLFTWVCGTFAVSASLFFAGVPVSPWALAAGAATASIAAWRLPRGDRPRRAVGISAVCGVAIAGAAVAIALQTYDLSWDGPVCHQQAVLRLASGWNPVSDPPIASRADDLCINHYTKSAWIAAAAVYGATGHLEAGKSIQLVLIVAAGLLAFAALREVGATRRTAAIAATLLALNPVAIYQTAGFCVDGLLASSLLACVALAMLWSAGPDLPSLATLVLGLAFLSNVKVTGAVFAGFIVAAVVLLAAARRLRVHAALVVAGFLVGVAALGWNPNVTNTLRHGHPLYPLGGAEALDILTPHETSDMHGRGRLTKLAISLFAETSNAVDQPARFKLPFAVRARELVPLSTPNTHLGGFGPLFGGALLLAAAALVLAWIDRVPARLGGVAAIALVLLTALVHPGGWWARYAPHVWWLPVIALVAGARGRRPTAVVSGIIAVTLAVNVALTAAAYGASQVVGTRARRNQLAALARESAPVAVQFGTFEVLEHSFREARVAFAAVAAPTCERPIALVLTPVRVCLAGGRSPPPELDHGAALKASFAQVGLGRFAGFVGSSAGPARR